MALCAILLENNMKKKVQLTALLEKHTDWCGFTPSQKFKHNGHVIKFLLTELGQARQENIWLSARTQRPKAKYLPIEPSHSVNKYIVR